MPKTFIHIIAILIILSLLYTLYLRKGYTDPMTAKQNEMIQEILKQSNRRELELTFQQLEYTEELTIEEKAHYIETIQKVLNDFDKQGIGSLEAFETRILSTLEELGPLLKHKILRDKTTLFFRIANIYWDRPHPLSFANELIEKHIDKYLVFEDKIKPIRKSVENYTQTDSLNWESPEQVTLVMEILLRDIDKVARDSTMKTEEYRNLVTRSLDLFNTAFHEAKPEYTFVRLIPNTYHSIGKVLNTDVIDLLIPWYQKHIPQYTPPGFDELQKEIESYLDWAYTSDFITASDQRKIKQIIQQDIIFFKNTSDSSLLVQQAKKSLAKLERMELETNERETLAEFYFDLAKNKQQNIGKRLDDWMYGEINDEELEKELAQKLPWER